MSDMEAAAGPGPWGRDRFVLFGEDFDQPRAGDIPEPELIRPGYSAADIAAARAEAWAEGYEAGTTEAKASAAAGISAMLESLATTLRDTRDDVVAGTEQAADAIAHLLMNSLAAVLPALCARYGDTELCALARTILPALAREPSVTVRVNPMHVPALTREIDRLDPDLIEHVQLVPVAEMAPGDVRAAWQDGVAVRNGAELWRQVLAVLAPAGLVTSDTASAPVNDRELQHAK